MKRSPVARLVVLSASLVLTAIGALNSSIATRPARASTVHTVTSTADSGPGSLRDAVAASVFGDSITFNLALPATISLTSGEINVVSSITVSGPGANLLTVNGNHISRVFSIALPATVTITGLTIANGTDAVDNAGGAGISNFHQLTVSNCNFTGNQASGDGGGIENNGPILTVTNCTFSNNSAGTGGGIASLAGSGSLETTNCTFNNNTAVFGAGVENISGIFVATNCTFGSNTATTSGGAIEGEIFGGVSIANCTMSANSGGGVVIVGGLIDLQNTIIADSIGAPDCLTGSPLGLNSHNLIKDGSCSPMLSGNPMLGPLQNNGGPTPTMALLGGSPAIDAGDDSVLGSPFTLATDQRGAGFPRKAGAHVDIGAFEVQATIPVGPSFDTCLKDNTSGNLLQWNRTTGQYQFFRCSDNFILTGTGTVALVNGGRTLTDFKSDRRISAGFNTGQLTGNATIYLMVTQGVWQTFRVIDTNPSAVCKC